MIASLPVAADANQNSETSKPKQSFNLDAEKQRAQQGDGAAALRVADYYAGPLSDWVAAVPWYKKAAETGDTEAQFSLAHALFMGRGTAKNQKAALVLFDQAATAGHVGAILWRAEIQLHGLAASMTPPPRRPSYPGGKDYISLTQGPTVDRWIIEPNWRGAAVNYEAAAKQDWPGAIESAAMLHLENGVGWKDWDYAGRLIIASDDPAFMIDLLPALSKQQTAQVQQALFNQGFDPKGVDGAFGANSRAALAAFRGGTAKLTLRDVVRLDLANSSEVPNISGKPAVQIAKASAVVVRFPPLPNGNRPPTPKPKPRLGSRS